VAQPHGSAGQRHAAHEEEMRWPYRRREKAAGDGEPHRRASSAGESGAAATHTLLGRRQHGERRPAWEKGER
jgi:hypothetical protein